MSSAFDFLVSEVSVARQAEVPTYRLIFTTHFAPFRADKAKEKLTETSKRTIKSRVDYVRRSSHTSAATALEGFMCQ